VKNSSFRRVIIIILDSVGIGELPDAEDYHDKGSNTLLHVAESVEKLHLPHLFSLGLINLLPLPRVEPKMNFKGNYGKMMEKSPGKDTTTGHWEIAGLILSRPFPTYPQGFPPEIIQAFEKMIGRKVLGNRPASGTEIIHSLGEEHLRTGSPIVYTSADSVFQIAAHEQVMPLPELYAICQKARKLLQGEHAVCRVIARPFAGEPGFFYRTKNRRDFSLLPPGLTILDKLQANFYPVLAVGKIEDLFSGRGITKSWHTGNNREGIEVLLHCLDNYSRGLIMVNLIDFDMLFGHRNDPRGYARALEEFDRELPSIISRLGENDILILAADHGCDPTTPSTDHSREYVPLLVFGPGIKSGVDLGVRSTFSDIAQTVAEIFGVELFPIGKSFLSQIIN